MQERLNIKKIRELEVLVNQEAKRCHLYRQHGFYVTGIDGQYFLYHEMQKLAEGNIRTVYSALSAVYYVLQLI